MAHSFRPTIRALLVIALTGCGHAPVSGNAEQRDYLLESAEHAPTLKGLGMHLSMGPQRLAFTANCNHYTAPYTVAGNRLVVSDIAGTLMGCDKDAEQKDSWLLAFLRARPSFTRTADRVTLSDGRVTLHFVDRSHAEPDRELVGSVWRVRSYVDGSGSTGILGIADPQLTLREDGTWQVTTACSVIKGHHQREADRLVLSGTVSSPAQCQNDNERASDSFVREVFHDGVLSTKIQAKMLELRDGERAVVAWTE